MISITIPVISGRYLKSVIESIYSQSYNDYEIIVINGTNKNDLSPMLNKYLVKELKFVGSLMEARWQGALNSQGGYILQLDETRALSDKKCLEKLVSSYADAAYIKESEYVNSILSKAANIDRDILYREQDIINFMPSVIPRFYKTEILIKSFEKLRDNLKNKFTEITAPEDLLLFIEAKEWITTIKVFNEPMIMHLGDSTLKQVIRKYYRYGTNFSLLKGTPYENLSQLSLRARIRTRIKNASRYSDLLLVIYLLALRGISAELGKLKGVNSDKKTNG